MKARSLLVSRDEELLLQLRDLLLCQFDCDVEQYRPAESADDGTDRVPSATVFLDTRAASTDLVATLVARQSGESPPGINVVTIGAPMFSRSVAARLDLLALAHIDLPLKPESVARSLDFLRGGGQFRAGDCCPGPRVIQGREVSIWSYTPELFPVMEQLLRIAPHDVTLLLVGETGTGKTTLAKLIHELSPRHDRPFQNLACGALPRDLIESELFGHARGAFTGADRTKIGRFEAAGCGTLLLDEIDVLGPKEQAKLLKVIETGEYEMVGSTETRHSLARLIVASNVDLETLTNSSQFRADLYYRLNVLEFRLPPLRERPLDIVPLAMQFVDECSTQYNIEVHRVHRDFLDGLKRYHWPGNIRELKNHIRRSVLFCENGELTPGDLSPNIVKAQFAEPRPDSRRNGSWTLADRVARSEREILESALLANNHKRTATAKALGISRVGLYKKMRKYGMIETKERV